MLRRCLPTALACTFAACAASPWTVRVENARDEAVPLVRCIVAYENSGNQGSSDVRPRYTAEFAGPRGEGAPQVELHVFWVAEEPPVRAWITHLDPSTDGITIRLSAPRTIELGNRRGNAEAVLQTEASPR